MDFLKKIGEFFIYTNLFLSLCVTSLVFETSLVLEGRLSDWKYPLFLFCSTLFLYCFHRLYRFDFRAPEEQLAPRHLWIKEHKILFLLVFSLSALGVLASVIFFVSLHTLLFLIPVALISFGYTIPCIPTRNGWLRLRDFGGIKVLLIAFVLGLTTVLLPVLSSSNLTMLTSPALLFVFFRRMLFIFAITIPFDIRDMDYDREKGTLTIPVVQGISSAKRWALAALLLFIVLMLLQYFLIEGTRITYAIALIVSAITAALALMKTDSEKRDGFYSFFLEGMMLLQCLLVIAASKW